MSEFDLDFGVYLIWKDSRRKQLFHKQNEGSQINEKSPDAYCMQGTVTSRISRTNEKIILKNYGLH